MLLLMMILRTLFPRLEAPIDTHVTNLREKIELPISSLSDTPYESSILRDVIDDALIKPNSPIPFAQLYEFEEGEESKGDDNLSLIHI